MSRAPVGVAGAGGGSREGTLKFCKDGSLSDLRFSRVMKRSAHRVATRSVDLFENVLP